jgi:hypothetical protein
MASSVTRAHQALEQIFDAGNAILGNMAGTRQRLKVMWLARRITRWLGVTCMLLNDLTIQIAWQMHQASALELGMCQEICRTGAHTEDARPHAVQRMRRIVSNDCLLNVGGTAQSFRHAEQHWHGRDPAAPN